jgi:hypothetical protein
MIKVTAPSDRAVILSSTSGATFSLEAGETIAIPPYFAPIAAEYGCAVVHLTEAEPPPAVPESERKSLLLAAVRKVIEKGDPNEFTANGKPRKAAVQALVTFDFTGGELAETVDYAIANPA